jgi:hypothetical protein
MPKGGWGELPPSIIFQLENEIKDFFVPRHFANQKRQNLKYLRMIRVCFVISSTIILALGH